MTWFAVFLYLWAAGISGALTLIPPAVIGTRFFRFHTGILLVLVTIATAVGRPLLDGFPEGTLETLIHVVAWVLAADVVALSFYAFSRVRTLSPVPFLLPVITGALLATIIALGSAPGRPGHAALLTVHLLTSGALLGSVLVAMNLGHAYLQKADLSFDHLVRAARLFLGSAIAKTIVSLVLLAPRAREWWAGLFDTFDGMLVLVRVVAGLGGSLVLAYGVLSCAKSRANQSATGILYAAVIVVLVGEAISIYLTFGQGMPA